MLPMQSNGMENDSRHTGLNPLFLTTDVWTDRVRAEDIVFGVALVGAEYATFVDSGRMGELVQSGTWRRTSTKGSTTDLSMVSSPSE